MKILVAVDVSQAGQDAGAAEKYFDASRLSQMETLVGLKGSELTLLFVQEELPSFEAILKTQANFPEDLDRTVASAAQAKLAVLAEKFESAGATVKVEVVQGPPAYMIEQVAKDKAVDLTVVTSGHHGDRFMVGGVSQHIIRHSPSSVLVLRQGSASLPKVERILVAVDGSERCLESVASALQKLNLDKSQISLTICHVVVLSPLVASFTPQSFVTALEENMIMEGEVALANAKKALSNHGYKAVEIELGHGNAAVELIKLEEKLQAQLIVIASQGKGAVKHFLMGHVANRIVTHASAPTIVAR